MKEPSKEAEKLEGKSLREVCIKTIRHRTSPLVELREQQGNHKAGDEL